MVHSIVTQLAFTVMFVTCFFAIGKGGPAERWGASVICLAWVSEILFSMLLRRIFSPPVLELTLLAIDGALAVGLLVLALRFAKMWLGTAMLLQSGELGLHGAEMTDLGLPFPTYLAINNGVSFAMLALLLGATVSAWRQRVLKRRQSRDAMRGAQSAWREERDLGPGDLAVTD